MVRLLGWVARIAWRDLGRLSSIAGNNFVVLGLYLLQGSGPFLPLLLATLLFFPLTADPFRKIPAERMASWPLVESSKAVVRLACVAFSPGAWIVVAAMFVFASPRLALELAACALVAHAVLPRLVPGASSSRLISGVPRLPSRLGMLLAKDLRQMVTSLDFYLAALLSVAGAGYLYFAPNAEPEAELGITVLIVLALSTHAQALFGRDGEGGLMRYRLLGLRGAVALASKGLTHVVAVAVLTAPLAPAAGLAGALASLAVGHHVAVNRMFPQQRWRFVSASLIPHGVVQVVALAGAAAMTYRESWHYAAGAAGAYSLSALFYGYILDRLKPLAPIRFWI